MNEDERKKKIYSEILEEARRQSSRKLPGEFTKHQFSKEAGINRELVDRFFDEKVKDGTFLVRKAGRFTYYSIV